MAGHRLTNAEKKALGKSAELWNAFMDLPWQHPDERDEFRAGLHSLQRIILARPTYRAMQDEVERK